MTESQQLLAEYIRTGSEPAFHELVRRYTDLVYSAAVRLLGGDTHLAQDITQTVFVDFARKARKLPKDLMLGGWLHHHTVYVALNIIRAERRRQAREREAVEMNALEQDTDMNRALVTPILDEAIDQLEAEDRRAIILRFFEESDLRSVGRALGSTDEAARKRVSRALGKLQTLLQHRGVSLSVTGLGAILATQAVTAAPAGLPISIAATALASAGAGGAAVTLVEVLNMTKLKLVVAGTVAIAGVAVPLLIQQRSQVQLRRENLDLHQRIAHLAAVAQESAELSNRLAQTNRPPSNSDQLSELLRLRGEVGRLRDAERELAKLRQQNANLAPSDQERRVEKDSNQAGPPRFIFVAGEVNTPGRLVWTNGMTLDAVIEMAHGYTAAAHPSLARIKDADGSSITVNFAESSPPVGTRDFIQPGTTVFIPRSDAGDGGSQ